MCGSYGNHWLISANKKKVFHEIDATGIDVWTEGGTFGDFIDSLNKEQMDMLMSLRIRDFISDPDEFSFGIEIIAP